MSRQNVETVERLFEAFRAGDLSAAVECLDRELVWITAPSAIEGTYRGHDGYARFVADARETFATFELSEELRDLGDDRVLASGTIKAVGTGSGLELRFPFGGIFSLRRGKVVRWQDFGSEDSALAAVGLSQSSEAEGVEAAEQPRPPERS